MARPPTAPPPPIRRGRCSARDQERWLFEQLARVTRTLDRAWPAGADVRARQRPGVAPECGSRWTNGTATRPHGSACSSSSKRRGPPNPIVLSGDVHVHYGADLEDEFCRREVRDRLASSSPTPRSPPAATAAKSRRRGSACGRNPHLRFHSNRRGYVACTATTAPCARNSGSSSASRRRRARTAGALVVEAGRKGATSD